MVDSFQKSCSFITSLALGVIAVQLIPFSRDKELSNHCREYLAISNIPSNPERIKRINQKRREIEKKAGIGNNEKGILEYCNSFYLNQK